MPRPSKPQGAILITGASSGIGMASARFLCESGYFIFAGVRMRHPTPWSLATIGGEEHVLPVELDVTKRDDVFRASEVVRENLAARGLRLAGLINNAAAEHLGPIEVLPIDVFRHEMEVGYLGAVSATKTFLPLLREGKGRIVNMSSVNGLCTFKYHATTCATKYALEAFSDALRMEVKPWGMHVAIVEPGPVDTPLMREKLIQEFAHRLRDYPREQLDLYFEEFESTVRHVEAFVERIARPPRGPLDKLRRLINGQGWLHPPADVARAIGHAMTSQRPKTRYLIGAQAKLIYAAKRYLGTNAFDRVLGESVFDF